jgi:predicted secreted protein
MSNTEIADLVVGFALVVAWIAVVVLPLLPLARKTAQIEKLTVNPGTVASTDREGNTSGVIDDEHARDTVASPKRAPTHADAEIELPRRKRPSDRGRKPNE